MALTSTGQEDFSGGIYRGKRSPPTAVYDAIDALVNDENQLFKRGGSGFKSNANAGTTLLGMMDTVLPATAFFNTVFWSATKVYGLQYSDDATPVDITPTQVPRPLSRGAGVGAAWYVPTAATGTNQLMKVVLGTSTPNATNQTVPPNDARFVAAVGIPSRLIVTSDNRAYFSALGDATSIDPADYHELPQNAQIIGADSSGDTGLLFTTVGVWAISNMSLAPVDDFGNIQHQVSRVNDLILWGDPGIASFAGGLIVPAIDDVFLFTLGAAPQPITGGRGSQYDGGIRALYSSYVKAGYQPGLATVHRGHYWLPIVNGTTWVDTLVCRLDHGFAWTRWSGHSADIAYAQRVGSTTRLPKLWSISGQRMLDLTGALDPTTSNAVEADGTTHSMVITTRDYSTGGAQDGFVDRVRATYELVDDGSGGTAAPTVAVAFSSDEDAGAFTTLTDVGQQGGGAGWGVSAGDKYQWAKVKKRRGRIRYRLTFSGASASAILRSIEMLTRQSGKQ